MFRDILSNLLYFILHNTDISKLQLFCYYTRWTFITVQLCQIIMRVWVKSQQHYKCFYLETSF